MYSVKVRPQSQVTPLVGVWIEILEKWKITQELLVTPLVGVWIEIIRIWGTKDSLTCVTPLVGVWIEIDWI